MQIELTVNGQAHAIEVEPRALLVTVIRESLRLTGTHIGCDTSSCGVCTVLLEGTPVKSCTMFAVQANGHELTTVEGLASGGALHPVQEPASHEHHPRRAEAALQAVLLHEALLHGVERAVLLEVLHGADGVAGGHGGEHRAALHRLALHQHGAGAAVGGVAPPVRAGEAEHIADEVHEQEPGLHLPGHLRAVHGHLHLH